jgi:hypothetical protein
MGNPLKVVEDMIELEKKGDILNSLLRIVTFLCNRYAMGASNAALYTQKRPSYSMNKIPLPTEKKLHTWPDIIDCI